MAETMQVRLKSDPNAQPITIQRSAFDAELHTPVNANDVKQPQSEQQRKSA